MFADGEFTAYKMPETDGDLLEILEIPAFGHRTAYLEDLVKYAGRNMPSSSMAIYASNYGKLLGMLLALRYRIVLTKPQAWQKSLALGNGKAMGKTAWKNKLKSEAERLFPCVKVTLATADALLILEAAKRGHIG